MHCEWRLTKRMAAFKDNGGFFLKLRRDIPRGWRLSKCGGFPSVEVVEMFVKCKFKPIKVVFKSMYRRRGCRGHVRKAFLAH
jgi:hypothetical protein